MASTTAPENRNMTPYVAVRRSRTVRRGNRERRSGRVVGTFLIASVGTRRCAWPWPQAVPRSGCLAGPNSGITDGVRAVLAPLPYNQHMDTTIEVSGVHKRFGPTMALDGMTFTVQPGRVTGFVGPNGAGKSTTMRVILGLDAPDEGSALVGGRPYRSLRHPMRYVGSLLDAGALQPSRSGRGHRLWLAHSQGLT